MRPRRSARSLELLVDELMTLSPGATVDRIDRDPRFHSPELARLLAERSAAALPGRPEDSARLGSAALRILDHLPALARVDSVAARVSCLIGNACRLRGDFDRAEKALAAAAPLITSSEESALHLRSYALLRWEQGRCDEAVGLMSRAERLYREADLSQDASTSIQLLILFHAEMGEASDAISLFNHPGSFDPSVRPWLATRAAYTAAFCLADHPDLARPEEAGAALARGNAWMAQVRDRDERLQLEWLQARARARMGDQEAERPLLALRQRCTAPSASLDFHLLTLDLIALRIAAGRGVQDLLEDLANLPTSIPAMRLSADAILLNLDVADRSNPWSLSGSLGFLLRRSFRIYGFPVPRLPFP